MNNKNAFFYSLLSSVFVLSIVPLVRFLFFDSLFPSSEPYLHLTKDTSFNLLLSLHPFIPYLLGPLLGIASVIICFLLLKRLDFKPLNSLITVLVLISSPAFIYLFSVPNPHAVSIFLILFGYLLFPHLFSFLPFAFACFFHPINFLIIIFLLLAHSIVFNKDFPKYPIAILAAIFFASHIPFIIPSITSPNPLITSVSDLGGLHGFGIFSILLSFLGLYYIWLSKKQLIPYSLLFMTILLSFYFPFINLFLNFLISLFAAFGFVSLLEMKWRIDIVRTLTIFLLICGIVFSSVSYLNYLSTLDPSPSLASSLGSLDSHPVGIVFSHPKNSFFINYFSDKPTLPDSFFQSVDADTIFHSRNLEITKTLLSKHDISYIIVDPEMKNGLVWSEDGQGLVFLFRNSKTFKNLYSSDDLEVWQVK